MFGDIKLSHISEMDIFVHTSRWDVIPTATLEAACLGKPLLVSLETNMSGFVVKYGAGINLENNTYENIANAMEKFHKLFHESKINDWGEKSIRMVTNEFKWQNIATQMLNNLYQ